MDPEKLTNQSPNWWQSCIIIMVITGCVLLIRAFW